MQLHGFDLVLQMTSEVFQPLIQQRFTLPGNEQNEAGQFPQEFSLSSIDSSQGDLDVHAIVTGISSKFLEGNIVEVRIPFERSRWTIGSFGSADNLAGDFVMKLPFTASNVTTAINGEIMTLVRVQIPDQTFELELDLTDGSLSDILEAWPLPEYVVNRVLEDSQEQIAEKLRELSLPLILNDFPLHTDGGNGTLNPMRPRSIEVRTIYSAFNDSWDLGVMGMMINGKAPGQAGNMTSAIIDRTRNVVAGISEETINKVLLAGPVANALSVPVSQLPPEFGQGRPLLANVQVAGRLFLDDLQTSLQPNTNTIRFDMGVFGTGDDTLLNSLTADGNLRLGIGLDNGALVTDYLGSNVDVDLDLTFLGWLANGITFGQAENLIENFLNNFVHLQLQTSLDGLRFEIPLDFSQAGLDNISITLESLDICSTEAIAIYGRVSSDDPPADAVPTVTLSESLFELSRTQTGSNNNYEVPEDAFCQFMRETTYVLRDFDVEQRSTIIATPRLLGRPITYNWEVGGQMLNETEGVVKFTTSVWAYDPDIPTGDEEIIGEKEVEVRYKKDGNRLELYNRPEDATFRFVTTCIARDSGGKTALSFVWVDFQGKQGEGYDDFSDDLRNCWAGAQAEWKDPREYELDALFPVRWFIELPLIPLCDPLGWGWINIPGLLDSLIGPKPGESFLEINGNRFNAPILEFNPNSPYRKNQLGNPTYINEMVKAFKEFEARAVAYYSFVNPDLTIQGGNHTGAMSHNPGY